MFILKQLMTLKCGKFLNVKIKSELGLTCEKTVFNAFKLNVFHIWKEAYCAVEKGKSLVKLKYFVNRHNFLSFPLWNQGLSNFTSCFSVI